MTQASPEIRYTGGFAKFVRAFGLLLVAGGAGLLGFWRYQEVEDKFKTEDIEIQARAGDFSAIPEEVETVVILEESQEDPAQVPMNAEFSEVNLSELTGDKYFSLKEDPIETLIDTSYDGGVVIDQGEGVTFTPAESDQVGEKRGGAQINASELKKLARDVPEEFRADYREAVDNISAGAEDHAHARTLKGTDQRNEALQNAREFFRQGAELLQFILDSAEDVERSAFDPVRSALKQAQLGLADCQKMMSE